MSGFAGGWNPASGWDAGGPPPVAGAGQAVNGGVYGYGGGYGYPMPTFGTGAIDYGTYNLAGMMPGTNMMPQQSYGVPGPPNGQGPVYTMNANGYSPAMPVFPGQPRNLQPHPVVNPDVPALNLQNSTGGAGCEPGYNYYFPAEHTKLHVLKSREPPWRLPPSMSLAFCAYHVPVNTTLGDLMKGFGATNPTPRKNRITEVVQGGNGKWYKGITFCADDKDNMKNTLKELGWDRSRTGRTGVGEKPVVWLWVTKD
ncbi:uncharacterized protein BCR38DRAFT_471830 [Pseudomassariella vexata]|uniref:Uncharacterized protein n=1 Tax=Pseudomassariella vexata TaxID=1141098 RepID=A0A1Y2E9G5_9PEZI|nr:uncharacterized protein BCR38DRAFT_471830 [Pseudomassariella vexata]ORY68213.1 hypothetical protein BCR38DRAFT_471830 [Pseudomassariella vexata]